MTRTTIRRALLASAPLALLLAPPRAASAACPVTVSDYDKNGVKDIRITGTTGVQKIIIDAKQDSTVISLDCDGDGGFDHPGYGDLNAKVYASAYYNYEVRLKGNDTIVFNVADTWTGTQRALDVNLGGGNNKVTVSGPGAMTAGSRLVVSILGVGGGDAVALVVPTIDASSILFKGDLNDGNNSANIVNSHSITGGSLVRANVALGGVTNTYKFTESGVVDATLDVNIDGGTASKDTGTGALSGQIGPNGRLSFRAGLGPGDDSFVTTVDLANFSIAAGGEVRYDLQGGPGADTLKFTRNGTFPGPGTLVAGLLDLNMNGGDFNDTVLVDLAGGGVTVDGTLRVRADGGSGYDTVTVLADVAAASATPNLDVSLQGGPGLDTLTLTLNDNGPATAANYGPAGMALVDGGWALNDKCTIGGANVIAHKRNCEL